MSDSQRPWEEESVMRKYLQKLNMSPPEETKETGRAESSNYWQLEAIRALYGCAVETDISEKKALFLHMLMMNNYSILRVYGKAPTCQI